MDGYIIQITHLIIWGLFWSFFLIYVWIVSIKSSLMYFVHSAFFFWTFFSFMNSFASTRANIFSAMNFLTSRYFFSGPWRLESQVNSSIYRKRAQARVPYLILLWRKRGVDSQSSPTRAGIHQGFDFAKVGQKPGLEFGLGTGFVPYLRNAMGGTIRGRVPTCVDRWWLVEMNHSWLIEAVRCGSSPLIVTSVGCHVTKRF